MSSEGEKQRVGCVCVVGREERGSPLLKKGFFSPGHILSKTVAETPKIARILK